MAIYGKDGILMWRQCPSCDAQLPEPVDIGEEWHCETCGECGVREPGPYDRTWRQIAESKALLSPEQQIANVLDCLIEYVDGPAYESRMGNIRSTVHQLSDMWERYQQDRLQPVRNDGLPF